MSKLITKIEQQKKKKNRYSLFSGEKFITGVSEETLLEFNIYQGKELTTKIINKIIEQENLISIREQAWRFLSRRAHSVKELHDKLVNKGFNKDKVNQILEDLKIKDYLNDDHYARQLILDEINLKKSGPLLIKNKLIKKGIEFNIVDELLDELYDEAKQIENCQKIAEKKSMSFKNKELRDKNTKLTNCLIQKGFEWDICNKVILEISDMNN
jgi:regulatory protein